MYITPQQDLAARKLAMPMLRDIGVKNLSDMTFHEMRWNDLCAAEKRLKKGGADLMDSAESADTERRSQIETAYDGIIEAFDAIRAEKDIRTSEGSRDPRAQAQSKAQIAKRPQYEPRTSGDDEAAEVSYALKPEQRFTTWAQGRTNSGEEYRGLSVGQYLRSMVVGGKTEAERRALSEGSDSAGGYTVPDVLSAHLIDLARAESVVMRAGAQTVPLTSDTNNIAKVLTDPVPG
ncbi:phage major capsid protein [Sulfitobacter mediterraneus]|uniref:phage major capsid protein n=1 Tax=Sulfitobacter mediterraneus TaxID=83219 RepID=UPI0019348DA3|nr:phage major capsid protein [Sulfitobacter mediterraneus]MBM1309072.1 phage major capsid protein [Sulfitobacter mediterraneus]MBM1312956.1 phage major capsid protein [Sulfitobacter mediterraneus]MBM1321340.1 phage major capsid protein [Sulfitobacter mediterraneus]MBM1325227.1 phage major capsid protein [Sulfitobacter mediterraneus]MBM1396574.1 phage major capsid protein [Sulfitobacter mediterraneus]